MAAIKNLTAQQLKDILTGETRSKYQIVDVREPDELQGNFLDNYWFTLIMLTIFFNAAYFQIYYLVARIAYEKIINLPLSNLTELTPKLVSGELLSPSEPIIFLCHHGINLFVAIHVLSWHNFVLIGRRSMKFATHLVSLNAGFDDVYNVEGGIHAYSTDCDPSIPEY